MKWYGNYGNPENLSDKSKKEAYEVGLKGDTKRLYSNPWFAKCRLAGLRRATGEDWMLSVVGMNIGTQIAIMYGVEKRGVE